MVAHHCLILKKRPGGTGIRIQLSMILIDLKIFEHGHSFSPIKLLYL